jgi:subtilisin family serine protease
MGAPPPTGAGRSRDRHPTPPPPPPPPPPAINTLCAGSATPAPGAQVALVAQGGTRPTVVKFQATTQAQVWTKVAQLNQTGKVVAVGPDQPVHAQVVNNPGENPNYTPNQIDFQPGEVNFPAAWSTLDGALVRVAVVDTGVQADHPDLAGNVIAGNDLVFGNASSNFARVDGYGHGTHVAGTIAALDNTRGVIGGAPHATIVPVRVLDCNGSGDTGTVASGVLWAADPAGGAAKVINLSLGGPGPDSVLASAIQTALGEGAVVVAAAGNCGGSGPSAACPSGAATLEYPGAYAGQTGFGGLIAVGALDGSTTTPDGQIISNTTTITAPDANFTPADIGFSVTDSLGGISVGTTITAVTSATSATISQPAGRTAANDAFTVPFSHRASFSNNQSYVTVAAPGVNILSTVPFGGTPISSGSGYAFLSGTSMATPHVAAVAALIFQRCGTIESPAAIQSRIVGGTKSLPSPSGFSNVGLLRADAVVSGGC